MNTKAFKAAEKAIAFVEQRIKEVGKKQPKDYTRDDLPRRIFLKNLGPVRTTLLKEVGLQFRRTSKWILAFYELPENAAHSHRKELPFPVRYDEFEDRRNDLPKPYLLWTHSEDTFYAEDLRTLKDEKTLCGGEVLWDETGTRLTPSKPGIAPDNMRKALKKFGVGKIQTECIVAVHKTILHGRLWDYYAQESERDIGIHYRFDLPEETSYGISPIVEYGDVPPAYTKKCLEEMNKQRRLADTALKEAEKTLSSLRTKSTPSKTRTLPPPANKKSPPKKPPHSKIHKK